MAVGYGGHRPIAPPSIFSMQITRNRREYLRIYEAMDRTVSSAGDCELKFGAKGNLNCLVFDPSPPTDKIGSHKHSC